MKNYNNNKNKLITQYKITWLVYRKNFFLKRDTIRKHL